MERSDQQLVSDSLTHDESAFEELLARYLKSIYTFIFRLVSNVHDAEDLTQEVFFKVWRSLATYRQEESFKTWVFSIARNTVIDWLRKKKSFVFSDLDNEDESFSFEETLVDPEPLPQELMDRVQTKEVLDKALGALPLMYREVVLLYYEEQLTFAEIGEILGKPLHTVKSQHRRALERLRRLLVDAPQ